MENQTQAVAKKDETETKMVNPPKAKKMYKVKILRDCMVGGKVVKEGTIVELPAAEAKELINFKVKGMYPFGGERGADAVDAQLGFIKKAELYVETPKMDEDLF